MHAAPVAPAVIDGSLAGTSTLAWVITQKYLDHLPLYRIEQIAARSQVKMEIGAEFILMELEFQKSELKYG
jgi:transposase